MKNLFLILSICFIFTSCVNTPKNTEAWMENQKNACLPTAIAFREGLRRSGIWAEVLTYHWKDPKTSKIKGHAITVYMYPPGKNQLYTYDHWGSYRTRAWKDNPRMIAEQAVWVRYFENWNLIDAQFLK
jgi:hypothetical protein